jgi:Tol biopolymer transport system component
MSSDGRYIAFSSTSSDLTIGDQNNQEDVFVHDNLTGLTDLVSVSSSGVQSNGAYNQEPAISGDGRYVAFWSSASNLVPNDTNNTADIFVRDRQTGITERVSVNSVGEEVIGGGSSDRPGISPDGRYVTFTSTAPNLVDGDTNNSLDVFVHDRQTGVTERVSVTSGGAEVGNAVSGSGTPSISADGRYVSFISSAADLVVGDTNNVDDVFIHDRVTGTTQRVSVDSAGAQANATSAYPEISGDGRSVAFESSASNLVPGDTNNASDVFVHAISDVTLGVSATPTALR